MSKRVTNWFITHIPVEEDLGLHENKAFRRWIGYPLLFIFLLVIAITWDLYETGVYSFNKSFLINSATLNDFAKFYAFPIAALAVPLTFGVMFNRFHSSKQKAKSNRLVENNNTANNFYTHYKYFREHCELVIEKQSIEINIDIFYNFIFPEANVNKFSTHLNPKFIELLEKELEKLNQKYQKYSESPYKDPYEGKMFRASIPDRGELKAFSHKFEFYGFVKVIYINKEKQEYHLTQYNAELQKTYDIMMRILRHQGVSIKEEAIDFIKKLSINMKS
ncbi:hypothetical protein [Pseudoalteromonas fuliginea]|uniref:hypothetical protein n=1 Tax=Pseudoalteromonas fuliginea TaxID=1872678 RepID=UPI00316E930D